MTPDKDVLRIYDYTALKTSCYLSASEIMGHDSLLHLNLCMCMCACVWVTTHPVMSGRCFVCALHQTGDCVCVCVHAVFCLRSRTSASHATVKTFSAHSLTHPRSPSCLLFISLSLSSSPHLLSQPHSLSCPLLLSLPPPPPDRSDCRVKLWSYVPGLTPCLPRRVLAIKGRATSLP